MNFSTGEAEPAVENEIVKGRVFELSGAAEEYHQGFMRGSGGSVDDGTFIVHGREPGIRSQKRCSEGKEQEIGDALEEDILPGRGI
jgi:hypothetical protein